MITHPEKILFPDDGITKGELAAYYESVAPLTSRSTFGESSRFANRVAGIMVERNPRHLTQEFSKADRGGRIFIDTGRNRQGATFAAYTVRARPGAPVSAPCTWEEIARAKVGPQTFTLRTMPARVAAVGDLWSGLVQRSRRTSRPSA